jgi:hypothetical protein
MSAVDKPARERPALRVALVAGDPLRHQGLMAIIRGSGHAVVEHHGEADVVLVDGDGIDHILVDNAAKLYDFPKS